MQEFKVMLNGEDNYWIQSMSVAFQERPYFKVIENNDPDQVLIKVMQYFPEVLVWRTGNQIEETGITDIMQESSQVISVLVVDDPNHFNMLELLRLGIRGCLPARLLPRQIVQAVELIVVSGIVCLPRLSKEHLNGRVEGNIELPYDLTSREREILGFLCKNYSNQEIAASLCLAESTIKTHMHNIFRKMGIRKRSEAIAAVLNHQR